MFIAHAPNGYLWASGENSDVFCWFFFALDKLNDAFLLPVQFKSNGLESVTHASSFTFKIFSNFEVGTTIRCLVMTSLLLIRYLSLLPWGVTFWSWSVVIHAGSHSQPLHHVCRSYGYLLLSYEFWYFPKDTSENAFADTAHTVTNA